MPFAGVFTMYGLIFSFLDTLKKNQIRIYWERRWYRESFYLLAMPDYLSKGNQFSTKRD